MVNSLQSESDEPPKTVFTTGDIAKICKVAPRTVSKWFDSGRLPGYRIPGSQDRRIPRDKLVQFLKDHDIPLGELDQGLLLVSHEQYPEITEAFPDWTVRHEHSAFGAGIAMDAATKCAIVDHDIGHEEAVRTAATMRKQYSGVLIALTTDPLENRGEYNDVFHKPFDPHLLKERIHTLTGL